MDPAELADWLRLLATPGATRSRVRRLLATFGAPGAALAAPVAARALRVDPAYAEALAVAPAGHAALLEATCRWLEAAPPDAPRHVLTLGDAAYPPQWLQAADPPVLVYASGSIDLLRAPSIAIVGSRQATRQGLEHAREFARHLSEQGFTIVSGLAAGIDGAAHEGGLEGRGRTVAIVGTGLDIVYPVRHAALFERIVREGLAISEHSLGTPSIGHHFPQRNRLIAGLTRGTLVIEAALQSGSLITARLAAEAGREVFAIPGSIHSPQSKGCHQLIQQGAKLVETADDILQELTWGTTTRPRADGTAPTARAPRAVAPDVNGRLFDGPSAEGVVAPRPVPVDPLLAAMGHDPIGLDDLSARTGFGIAELGARLLDLELSGRVERLPGGRVQRRSSA